MKNQKIKIVTGEPLDLSELICLTKKDACTVMEGNKVRILSASIGQEVEVDKIVEWKGYKWGLRSITPQPRYDYMAYKVYTG